MVSLGDNQAHFSVTGSVAKFAMGLFSFQVQKIQSKPRTFFAVGVSKNDDFRHVDMGEKNDALRILWHPMLEISLLRKFRKSVSTLPRFLHRGIAGNMQPLAGGEVRMICWVLVGFRLRKFFSKNLP